MNQSTNLTWDTLPPILRTVYSEDDIHWCDMTALSEFSEAPDNPVIMIRLKNRAVHRWQRFDGEWTTDDIPPSMLKRLVE